MAERKRQDEFMDAYGFLANLLGGQQQEEQVDVSTGTGNNLVDNLLGVLGSSAGYALDPSLKPNYQYKAKTPRVQKKDSGIRQKDILDLAAKISTPRSSSPRVSEAEKRESRRLERDQKRKEKEEEYRSRFESILPNLDEDISSIIQAKKDDSIMFKESRLFKDNVNRTKTKKLVLDELKNLGYAKDIRREDLVMFVSEKIKNEAINKGYMKPDNKPTTTTQTGTTSSEKITIMRSDGKVAVINKDQLEAVLKKYPDIRVIDNNAKRKGK